MCHFSRRTRIAFINIFFRKQGLFIADLLTFICVFFLYKKIESDFNRLSDTDVINQIIVARVWNPAQSEPLCHESLQTKEKNFTKAV